jgi:hypothetical protein
MLKANDPKTLAKLDTAVTAPPKTNGSAKPPGSATPGRTKSKSVELEDTEEERLRRMRLESQEEKILVDPPGNGAASKPRPHEDSDKPQMSATSYPGQEWNPYAVAGDEDDLE